MEKIIGTAVFAIFGAIFIGIIYWWHLKEEKKFSGLNETSEGSQ